VMCSLNVEAKLQKKAIFELYVVSTFQQIKLVLWQLQLIAINDSA
jgi:hypothetical protein